MFSKTDNNNNSSSSSYCEATASIALVILSLYGGSAAQKINNFGLLQSGGP